MRAAISITLALASGCTHTGYLAQAAEGQWELLRRARPIAEVVHDPRAPLHVRRALSRIHEIRAFARRQGLNPSRSYEHYVQVGDAAVVWVVQGSQPLAFDARRWWFPIVGSVPYLGFFERARAQAYAQRLADDERLDVAVRGASAYSTLGWFDDPVLSTMIPLGPDSMGEFANVILHESVHATVYVPGQSLFNESLATFIGDRLTEAWLTDTFGAEDPVTRAWIRSHAAQRARAAAMRQAYQTLDALYASAAPDDEKLREKARILRALERRLGTRREINNAVLLGFKTYDTGTAAFERLARACHAWPRFLDAVRSLDGSDFPQPQAEQFEEVIDRIAEDQCGTAGERS